MRILLLALAFALLSAPAEAKKKKSAPPAPLPVFSVEVPRSELALAPLEEDANPRARLAWLLGASSWAPDAFRRPGFRGSEENFRPSGPPYLFGEVAYPLTRSASGAGLLSRFGLGFATLERLGPPAPGGTQARPRQELRLFQLRFGAEYESPRWFSLVQPYGGFALLPSLATSAQSQFEGRVSSLGLGMEAGAGVRVRPKFLRNFWSFQDGALGLGAQYVFGTVDGSSLRGLGFQGHLQVNL